MPFTLFNTTHRADPTIVFLPAEHEAMLKRSRRRKRYIVIGTIALAIHCRRVNSRDYAKPPARGERKRATQREQMAHRELRTPADGLERFKVDMGRYPPTKRASVLSHERRRHKGDDSEAFSYGWVHISMGFTSLIPGASGLVTV